LWTICTCLSCLNSFTYPQPELPEYEHKDFHNRDRSNLKLNYYSELPYDWKKLIEIQLDIINLYIPKNGSILEIGCGEGLLLHELALGLRSLTKKQYKLSGIEASISACTRGQLKGLDIKQGYFEENEFNSTFDCIVMSQVLEHIPDLKNFLAKLIKLIPNGYLVLTQTNYKGLIPRIQKEKWYAWLPDQHYWHFTLKGLTGILKKQGFERVGYKYSSLVHPHDWKYKLAYIKENCLDQFTAIYRLEA
jgi:2-polyprenyl-3-methyl-5-hydroxy-6-metoxy-1,4-benzoquinol methylase